MGILLLASSVSAIQVSKTEALSALDSLALHIDKQLSQTAGIVDALTAASELNKVEYLSAQDVLSLERILFKTDLSETVTIQDTISAASGRGFNESAALTDVIAHLSVGYKSDNIHISDSLSTRAGLTAAEGVSIADMVSLVISKPPYIEIIAITDEMSAYIYTKTGTLQQYDMHMLVDISLSSPIRLSNRDCYVEM